MRLEYPDPPLGDGIVRLRPWTMEDVPCVESASRDPAIPRGTTVPATYTADEGHAWIERQWSRSSNEEGLSLAVTDAGSDEALGAVVLLARPEPGLVGLGYWVIERARRRGLAARAVRLLAPWVLAQAPIVRIEALVEASNTNSGRVLLNAGFRPEGRLRAHFAFAGQPTDAVVYSLVAADFPPGWNSSSP